MPAAINDAHAKLNAHLVLINELLPGATPAGSYALGTITGQGLKSGKFPPRTVLEVAATVPDFSKAVELAKVLDRFSRGLRKWEGGR